MIAYMVTRQLIIYFLCISYFIGGYGSYNRHVHGGPYPQQGGQQPQHQGGPQQGSVTPNYSPHMMSPQQGQNIYPNNNQSPSPYPAASQNQVRPPSGE